MNKFDTKIQQVKEHLIKNKEITSWEAIQLYHATRLSAIIFILRDKGYEIESIWETSIDKEGRKSRYVRYKLIPKDYYEEYNENHIPGI